MLAMLCAAAAAVYSDGQGTASNDQLVIAEHEILDGCPETGLHHQYIQHSLASTTSLSYS